MPVLSIEEVDRCADFGEAGAGRAETGKVGVNGAGDGRVAGPAADLEKFFHVVGAEGARVDAAALEDGAHDRFGSCWASIGPMPGARTPVTISRARRPDRTIPPA
jgi:hypothetical protein